MTSRSRPGSPSQEKLAADNPPSLHAAASGAPRRASGRNIASTGAGMASDFECPLAECRRIEEAIRRGDDNFRYLFDLVNDGLLILNQDGRIRDINRTAYERLGYTRESVLGMHISQLCAPEYHHTAGDRLALIRAQGHAIFESAHLRKDGSFLPVEVNVRILELNGESMFFGVIRDITERKRSERALQMMQLAVDRMGDGAFWLTPDGRVSYVNEAACRALGYTREEMLNLRVFDFDPGMTPDVWPAHWEESRRLGSRTLESTHRTKSGKFIPVEITANHMRYENEEYHCTFVRDISKRKQTEEKIARLAHFDTLTGLPNRALLYDRLEQAIALAKRHRQRLAVLFLDLNGFKQINDNFGHYVGDDLLKAVAERLRENARDMDTVARVGGDEFIFILNEIGEAENAAIVAKKLIESVARPFLIQEKTCQIGVSVGISVFPEDGNNIEDIIKHADDAMYQAKKDGKDHYQFASQNRKTDYLSLLLDTHHR